MIKLNLIPGTYTANQTIPLNVEYNTNSSFSVNDNQIVIKRAGFIEINGSITFIGSTAGDIQVRLVDETNNKVLASATGTFAAEGDYLTLPIYDLLRVVYNQLGVYDKLGIQVNTGTSINNGIITAKYIK